MVRSAIFSMVGPQAVQGARVVDLYSGTGALGIEALSRGAAWVDFVEGDSRLCRSLRQNLEELGMAGRGRVYRRRVDAALDELDGRYDLVFADPPYDQDPWTWLMDRLERGQLLSQQAVLVLEHHRRLELAQRYGKLARTRSRRHGDTMISLYVAESADG